MWYRLPNELHICPLMLRVICSVIRVQYAILCMHFISYMVDEPIRKENTTPEMSQAPAFDTGVNPNKQEQTPVATPETRQMPAQETKESRETKIETSQDDGFLDEAIEGLRSKLKRPKKQKPTSIPQVRDEITVKVEKIMEEGLADAYKELSPIERQEFKIKGEETALQIRELLKSTHIKIKKIFRLLFEWLKMLPGINRFFLEQEAKIKADKIISLKNHDVD